MKIRTTQDKIKTDLLKTKIIFSDVVKKQVIIIKISKISDKIKIDMREIEIIFINDAKIMHVIIRRIKIIKAKMILDLIETKIIFIEIIVKLKIQLGMKIIFRIKTATRKSLTKIICKIKITIKTSRFHKIKISV